MAVLAVILAGLAGCDLAGAASNLSPRIVPVSTRAHLVTGGDVLLRIEGLDAEGLEVSVNGADVTAAFRPADDGRSLLGLVTGLRDGANEVRATDAAGVSASLSLANHPITGPIISGPHQQPFFCQTEDFSGAAGPLGSPLDEHCSIETRVDYFYFSSADGEFKPYALPSGGPPPVDVASATTLDGVTVPFIVRVETGTANRAIYEIAILHDPSGPAPDPWTRSPGWNGKLVYTHGGGCRSGWHVQGNSTGGVLREGFLEMGYAVTSASLNVFGQNCNDLIASETHIMVKERFVERYGEPVYTIATGASGGSYQSHQTADNYPGVFDGIIVSSSFPDVTSATIFTLADSRLLHNYFTNVAPGAFTQEQQQAVSGFGSWGSIANLSAGAARLDPTFEEGVPAAMQGGELSLPALEEMRYSAANVDGVRATVYDHAVNVYGIDETTGVAGRPLDNVGVQYGLAALNEGKITKEQFIALNRSIGGFDADLNPMPARHEADPVATARAFESGRILFGGAGLATTPVIDYRSYTDHAERGDIHMIVHQFSTRARLAAANGHADNHVMTVGGRWGFTEASPDLGELFRQMDRWLMNIRASAAETDPARRVVASRPADLVDSCWDNTGAERVRISEPLSFDGTGRCAELYPAYPTPRQVAGAPLANDIVKCALKPIDAGDYDVAFTEAELAELREIFADGVCDWAQGDVLRRAYGGTWASFGPTAGSR